MKLIKPLLIYITWIAFVVLIIGFETGNYYFLNNDKLLISHVFGIIIAVIAPPPLYIIIQIFKNGHTK